MALVVPPANDRKRVKVYELKNNDWFDRGTGFCTGQIINDEPRIYVESEDEPDRMLLETRIAKDDGYQKQQDTLIVWTEANGTDMALSFQEAEGCATIWDFVSHVQQQLIALAGPDDALSDDAVDGFAQPVTLPSPELGNLPEIEQIMRAASSTTPGRDSLSKFIIAEDYITKLLPLVSVAEDLESLTDLHRLCNIMKTLILLNDTAIIESVVTDEMVLGVVGALEYDPDFPTHKANHRQYLSDESKFKEVVPIDDPVIKKKIHHTYRLQYLKDVVLARILDDPTFSVLNSLIFFNQVDIVQHLQANGPFLKELFSVFSPQEKNQQRKKHGVQFIQQCCAIAKNLQAPARSQLYQHFIEGGLFPVINFSLRHEDTLVRIAGTDVLVAMIDHDPAMVRAHIFRAINEKSTPLTDTLIELLLVEVDLGVKSQIADAIKILLDPQSSPPGAEGLGRAGSEFLSKMRGGAPTNPQTESFIQSFYDESAKKLFQPLKNLEHRESMRNFSIQEVSLFSHLVEILCFFIRQHMFRSKYFILSEGLTSRVAQLLAAPEKHLKLMALKFFRTCIGLGDEYYNRQLIQHHLFEPILNIVFETMPRDNLLNSACLEMFEYIKRENNKQIITHLVDNYRDRLEEITYVDTFQGLVLRYDQMMGYVPELANTVGKQEPETSARAHINGGQRWQGVKEMDAAEEDYFNTSDDEEETPASATATSGANGASSTTVRPLVDYPDDEEDDESGEAMDTSRDREPDASASLPAEEQQPSASSTSPSPAAASAAAAAAATAPPPERLSEKRRREEDEEDELGKLSQTKRRSSSIGSSGSARSVSASFAVGGTTPSMGEGEGGSLLRRRRSLNNSNTSIGAGARSGSESGRDRSASPSSSSSPAGGPKKISISLSIKSSGSGKSGGKDGSPDSTQAAAENVETSTSRQDKGG
ncbi:DUF625-domain-containing protein [Xylona heveae TC161]|uniref:DUF625-domain-containing protein n=1 Tax=Xylona heveae (strain CBS 132557 / TC161) TaxID=1328760 RepID=A0A165H3B2_XYLHT|nr:DUF625-domain-containing protein [Xylona heveae TC161]KZF22928.1 DUF625-domain-containing protein [Xylona heveae TC161]